MLQLPVTIRVPAAAEMPHREDIEDLLLKRQQARIVEGFALQPNSTHQLPFRFYAAVNVNNSRLWEVFVALSGLFPGEVSCVYGQGDEEPITTGYFSKSYVLQELEKFATELTQDGSLEFGLLFHTKEVLTELLISSSKYLKCWGTDQDAFIRHLLAFGIRPVDGLEFIDEYPKIVEPLRSFLPAAKKPETVLYYLDKAFRVEREQGY